MPTLPVRCRLQYHLTLCSTMNYASSTYTKAMPKKVITTAAEWDYQALITTQVQESNYSTCQ